MLNVDMANSNNDCFRTVLHSGVTVNIVRTPADTGAE